MKLTNLKKVNRLAEQIKRATNAITDLNQILEDHPGGDSDGESHGPEKKLYGFHLALWGDMSNGVDLAGTMVGIEVIKFTIEKLKENKAKFLAELETL